jgi:hypothetical protein
MNTYLFTLRVRAASEGAARRVVAERVRIEPPREFYYSACLEGDSPLQETGELEEILTRHKVITDDRALAAD